MSSRPDPTLVPIFEAEVAEIVGTLQAHLLRLEQAAPDAGALLGDMLRLTHDVKGSARVVGYQHVSHLAHAFESRLQLWRGVDVVAQAEIGLGLAACDLLSQLTNGREAPELVARADELAHALEDRSNGTASATASSAAHATRAMRTPAMRVVQATESLRVSRERIDCVVDGMADTLVALFASIDRLDDLKQANHDLQQVPLPRDGISSREIKRVRAEIQEAVGRVNGVVRQMAEALRPLEKCIRAVDIHARDLCVVPCDPLAAHLERVARDTAALLGREVVFSVEGRDVHIDKELADEMKGPLTHAVRNAVDHGIELPAEREAAGKPRAGTLTLSFAKDDQSETVRLTLSDDGRGIDRAAVRARLGAAAEGLDDRALLATLLRAGVSTRESVTEISGRGLGLGSIATAAEELRGDATLTSEPQQGTTLELRLPLKLSLLQGLLVHAAGSRFIVPHGALVSVRTPCPTAVPLADVLGLPGNGHAQEIVVLRGRDGVAGLLVDWIDNRGREVVRRPLGAHLGHAQFVEGVTILGDGEPALILDPRAVAAACPQTAPATPGPAAPGDRRVLLVDDSLTLRARLSHVLVQAGFKVSQAGDGLEALALLGRTGCDAIVSDVQMPRMDGWQLLQRCTGRLPFVLMTARPEPDGLQRAQQSGACAYLAKDGSLGELVVTALRTAFSPCQESYP